MWRAYSAIGVVDVVESMLSFASVWEAKSVIGVVDFDMGTLKCDRVARFYSSAASFRRIQP